MKRLIEERPRSAHQRSRCRYRGRCPMPGTWNRHGDWYATIPHPRSVHDNEGHCEATAAAEPGAEPRQQGLANLNKDNGMALPGWMRWSTYRCRRLVTGKAYLAARRR